MELKVVKANLDEIRDMRVLFLQECNCQFICNKCHDYGWCDDYVFYVDGNRVGYGCVWGTDKREDRDTIFEFYIIEPFRKLSSLIFREFSLQCGAIMIEAQTNDTFLSEMLYEFADGIHAEAILFEDHDITTLTAQDVVFRKRLPEDKMNDDTGEYVLTKDNQVIATGGLMFNYNMPYADIYMEVNEPFRQNGYGSFLVQEIKRETYLAGRVPAARCNVSNAHSKATLLKAGFRVCGYRLKGHLKHVQ